jgi:hypothetical protein
MANAQQGRGKTKFREFNKIARQAYKEIVRSIRDDDEEYYSFDIISQFNLIFLAFVGEIEDEDIPNIPLWRKRAEEIVTKLITQIFDIFSENINEEDEEPEPDENEVNIGDDFITINGIDFPVITRENAPSLRRAGRLPRNRIFPTIDDVAAYIFAEDWPYEYIQLYGGIEIIRRGTSIVGYRIWIG